MDVVLYPLELGLELTPPSAEEAPVAEETREAA